jgi:hypothetical protein
MRSSSLSRCPQICLPVQQGEDFVFSTPYWPARLRHTVFHVTYQIRQGEDFRIFPPCWMKHPSHSAICRLTLFQQGEDFRIFPPCWKIQPSSGAFCGLLPFRKGVFFVIFAPYRRKRQVSRAYSISPAGSAVQYVRETRHSRPPNAVVELVETPTNLSSRPAGRGFCVFHSLLASPPPPHRPPRHLPNPAGRGFPDFSSLLDEPSLS